MKQKIRITCFVVAASVLAGLLLYGGVMAMYRLAAVLSLSPAITNLVPLVALGVLWLIGSPATKYFQRRTEHLFTRDKDEERRQAWLQIKAKGKKRYVWRTGVMGWGLPVFAIFTPVMLIFGPRTHQLSKAEIAGATLLSLLMWTIGGYFFGLSMWNTFDKKYR